MFVKVKDEVYFTFVKELIKKKYCHLESVSDTHYKIHCIGKDERLMATRELQGDIFINYIWKEIDE